MNIIMGFGSTEETYRSETKNKIEKIIKDIRSEAKDRDIFTDEQLSNIEKELKELAEQSRITAKNFSKNDYKDAPQRYSSFYVRMASTTCDIFIGVSYSHINTKHPMSPDGIAMMSVKEAYWFDFKDV